MNSPVDIKAVLDAMSDVEAARSEPIRVHVYLDDYATADLANIATAATRTSADHAKVLHDYFPPEHAIPDASADLAILVGNDGARAGKLYDDLHRFGVPTVVISSDRYALCSAAKEAGYPISADDVVAPDSSADADALPERAQGEPIEVSSSDAKYMFEQFGRWIVYVFKDKRLAFAHAFPCVRRPLALEAVNDTAVQNAGIGVVAIIPGADLPLMTLNQVKMLLQMAAAYDEELTLARVKEIAAIVGGAFGCRAVARQVVGLVPGIGWVVKGGIGYAGTQAMGHALIEYFESGANVATTGKSLLASIKGAPAWLGLSRDKDFKQNASYAVSATKEKVSSAAGNAARNLAPTIASVASAAGDATGFTKEDITGMANKAVNTILRKDR